jgi:RNA polymerase-binding protein DksA
MTRAQLERNREVLLALSRRLRGDLGATRESALRTAGGEASGSLSNAPLHLADLGTDNFDQELSLVLMENEQQILDQIGPALERIDRGTYGTCADCGRPIPAARLQALPYTARCVDCARRDQEQAGAGAVSAAILP